MTDWDTNDEIDFIHDMIYGKPKSLQVSLVRGYRDGFNMRHLWGGISPLRISSLLDEIESRLND